MSHDICLRLKANSKNTAEQFYNQIQKKVDKGKVEFGVDISVERIPDPEETDSEEPTPSSD